MILPGYIFDIDGTLANIQHRLHHIQQPDDLGVLMEGWSKDWDSFNENMVHDEPYHDVMNICKTLQAAGAMIWLVTGRFEKYRQHTQSWLAEHDVPWHSLYMRPDGDYRSDADVKRDIFWNNFHEKCSVMGVFEDRQRVVDMWRDIGLRCYQVKPGDY